MATSINVGINVTSNGTTDSETKKVKGLKDMLDGAEASAKRASRALSQASAPAGTRSGSRAQEASMSSAQLVEYNRGRATAGGTGASARDFSNQAQGLGGLVRIYATLAANIFAASAAFGALSRALDTTNMIKGLDQLGAASGTALGSLSQRLVLATDGAVSLREAMEATVKASSAGLNSDQILKMGQVAKQASLALGVNMTDALSRISRGVTKLEPELLDELGLFVKIDDAANKYALSVGKSASQLTDFERRQAFANETLAQGIKKFGEIDLQSNSYSRLAAQLSNLAQSGLELVNKFLTPVANILADNTGLLVGVLGVLGAKILKMAIPALGEWKAALLSAAKTAKESAGEINTSFAEYTVEGWEQKLGIPGLQASVNSAKTSFKDLARAIPGSLSTSGFAGALANTKDLENQKQLNTLLRSGASTITDRQRKIEALSNSRKKADREAVRAYKAEIDYINTILLKVKELQAEQFKLTTQRGALAEQDLMTPGTAGEWARGRIAIEANRSATALEALSRVSENTLRKGIVDSIKTLNKELGSNVGTIRRWSTLAAGSFAAVATSAGIMFNAISGYVAGFLILGGAVVGLIKYFSTSRREAELAGEAFDRVEGAVKNSITVVERLQKLGDPLEGLSIQSIDARATALKELGDSINLSVVRGFAQLDKMNAGDRFLDWVSRLWSGDVKSKMAEGLSDGIKQSFELIDNTDIADEVKKKLEGIVGASYGTANFNKALEELVKSDNKEKTKELAKALETLGNAAKVSSSKGVELVESFKQVNTTVQEFQRGLQPNDILYKIATQSTDALIKLDRALQDPATSLAALREASKDVNFLSMIPPESADRIIANTQALEEYSRNAAAAASALKPLQEEIATTRTEIQKNEQIIRGAGEGSTAPWVRDAQKEIKKFQEKLKTLVGKETSLKVTIKGPELEKLREEINSAIGPALEKQAKLAAARLAQELTTAQQYVTKTIASLLGGTEAGIKLQATLERQAIDAQGQLIRETRNLALEMAKNTATREQETLKKRKEELENMGALGGTSETGLLADTKVFTEYEAVNKGLQRVAETLKGIDQLKTSKSLVGASADLAKTNPTLYGLSQQTAASNVALQGIGNQKEASKLKEQFDLIKKSNEENSKTEQSKLNQLKSELAILDAVANTSEFASEGLKTSREQLRTRIQAQEGQIAIAELTNTETALRRIGEELNKRDLSITLQEKAAVQEALRADIQRVITQREDLRQRLTVETITQNINNNLKQQAEEQKKAQETQRLTELGQQRALELAELDFEMQSALNQELKDRNGLTETAYVLEKNRYDLLKLRAEEEKSRQAQDSQFAPRVTATASRVSSAEFALEQAAGAGVTDLKPYQAQIAAAKAEQQALNQEIAASTAHLDAVFGKRKEILAVGQMQALNQAQLNDLTAAQEKALQSVYDATEGLADVFGELGKTIADSLGSWVKNSQDNAKSRLKIDQDYNTEVERIARDRTTSQEEKDEAYTKAYKKYTQDNLKQDINYFSKNISGAKGMFKEKTVAYKALAAMEKIMHITKLAMWVKETFMDTARTGVAVANSATRGAASVVEAGIDGVKAVVKAISSLPFPLNLAAGAATAAVVASLLSQIGGKKPGLTGGQKITAEQRQEVQGSAMDYNDQGELVQVRRGVFGDTSAKSESIANSIEILKDNSIVGLGYDNRMLRALEKVANALTGAAGFLTQIKGITTGSLNQIVPGTYSEGGFLGIGGLFETKITKNIVDSGIKISGSFLQLSKAGQGLVKTYETVNTQVKDSGLFGIIGGSSYAYQETFWKDLISLGPEGQKAVESINKSFSAGVDVLQEVGRMAGLSAEQVNNTLGSINISLERSLRGLSGEQVAAELNSLLSNALDQASESLFSYYTKFSKFGEGLLQTVIRVTTQTKQAEQQLKNIGINLRDGLEDIIQQSTSRFIDEGFFGIGESTGYRTTYSTKTVEQQVTEIVDSLVEFSGGMEEFVSNTEFFRTNFLKTAEQLKPIAEDIEEVFSKYGLAANATRDDFVNAVQSLDLTTEYGRKAFADLTGVAEDFYKVTQKITELNLETRKLNAELLRAQGLTEDYKSAIRAIETEGFTPAEIAVYDFNEALKTQIEFYDSITKSIDSLTSKTKDLTLEYLKAFGFTEEYKTALRNLETQGFTPSQLAIYDYNQSLKDLIDDYNTTTKSVKDLETALSNAENALASASEKVVGIQKSAVQKYVEAQQEVVNIENQIADAALQTRERMSDLAKTLREFDTGQAEDAVKKFKQALTLALTGDVEALGSLTSLAGSAIEQAQNRASTKQQADVERKRVLIALEQAAKVAESRGLTSQDKTAEEKLADALIAAQTSATEALSVLGSVDVTGVADLASALSYLKEEDLVSQYNKAVQDQAEAQNNLTNTLNNLNSAVATLETTLAGSLVPSIVGAGIDWSKFLTYFDGSASDSVLKQIFDNLDNNKNKLLTTEELNAAISSDNLNSIFGTLNTSVGSLLTGTEFKGALASAENEDTANVFQEIVNNTAATAQATGAGADNSATAAERTSGVVGSLQDLYSLGLTPIGYNTSRALDYLSAILTALNSIDASNAKMSATNPASATASSGSGGGKSLASQVLSGAVEIIGGVVKTVGSVVTGVVDAVSSVVSSVGSAIKSVWKSIFSDERLKKNITHNTTLQNGINLYDFEYKDPKYGIGRKTGVLAQEIMPYYPEAVSKNLAGYYTVDYSKLPIPFNLLKFAQGGVFTNGIVDSPTMFPMGVMGEAGPEAVMPLTRGPGGDLGVVAHGGNEEMEKLMKELVKEVQYLRSEVRSDVTHNAKTARLLDRVIPGGDSLVVTASIDGGKI